MDLHVPAVCNISRIRRYLTAAATEKVVHAFFTNKLNVSNALLHRLPLKQIQRLQKVPNLVARLIEGAMKFNYGTPLFTTFSMAADSSAIGVLASVTMAP